VGNDSSQFWATRQHFIINSLVESGAFPLVSNEVYRKEFGQLVESGMPPHYACHEALRVVFERIPDVSACEVNPW
jgi:hypothetical protein